MKDSEKLKKYIDEIEKLISSDCNARDPMLQTWFDDIKLFIAKKFGNNSIELSLLQNITFIDKGKVDNGIVVFEDVSRKELMHIKKLLNNYLQEIMEEKNGNTYNIQLKGLPKQFDNKKIFIVHGHDGELKGDVALFIQKQDIDAIILSNQANQGKTIIEKIEDNSDVGCAVCLFTKDDIGKAKAGKETQFRARQNVVFETGYFYGKIGRDHTVIIYEDGVELPSDLQGIAYTKNGAWQMDLIRDLVKMGYYIDPKKI